MEDPGSLVGREAALAQARTWLAGRLSRPPVGPPLLLVSGEAGVGKSALVAAAALPGSVLVVEDLQDADDAALARLAAWAGQDRTAVATCRDDELPRAGRALRGLRARLRHDGRLADLRLPPLAGDDLAALVAVALGAPAPADVLAEVARRTGGVPGLVLALLAGAGADPNVPVTVLLPLPLPESVRDAVAERLDRLDPAARRAVEAAAVAGPEVAVAVVTAMTGEPWPDAVDDSGLLTGDAERRRFRRPLLHEAVYAGLGWSARQRLHAACAEAIARQDGPAAEVARHRLAAGDRVGARTPLLSAAAQAAAAGAHGEAVAACVTALEDWAGPGRTAAVALLAGYAELAGDAARALTALAELLPAGTGAGRADLLRRLAGQHESLGHRAPALSARQDAATAYDAAGCPAEAAVERTAIAVHLRSAGGYAAALDQLDLAARGATGRADLAVRVEGLRGNVLVRSGRADEGLAVVRAALGRALTLAGDGVTGPAAEVYQRLADSLEHAGDYRAARVAYESAYDFCREHDHDAVGQICRACATAVMFQGGRWDALLTTAREVLAAPASPAHARTVAQGLAGLVHAFRGRTRTARAELLAGRADALRIDLVPMDLMTAWGLALLDEREGRAGAVLASYRHVVERVRVTQERHYCLPPLTAAAVVFAAAGLDADLGRVTALLGEAAATTGQAEARIGLEVALAEAAGRRDGAEAAVPHLRQALDALTDLRLPVTEVTVRHRLALALEAGPAAYDEAAAVLGEAHRLAGRLQSRLLLDRLGADRARLDRLAGVPVGGGLGLSPREEQVLLLVAEGLTNRDVAARLHLSVRTVEMHVAHALTRLGCRNRAEAVARLTGVEAGGTP